MTRSTLALLPALVLIGCPAEDPKDTADTDTDTDSDTDSDSDTDTDTDTDTGGDTATADYSVTVTSPATGSSSYPGVTFTYDVEGLVLDPDAIGAADEEGHGHVHVHVDGEYVLATTDTTVTLDSSQLGAGTHTVEFRLADNSHDELGASAAVDVTVLSPSLSITSPTEGWETDSAAVQIFYSVGDFSVVDNLEGPVTVGEGHVHLMLDGAYYDYSTSSTDDWFLHLSPGKHTIGVMLVNNDHSELPVDGVSAETTIMVPDDAADIEVVSSFSGEWDSATLPLEVLLTNYTLDGDSMGGTAVDGVGHYHVYMDGTYYDAVATTTPWFMHVTPGYHDFQLVLAANDHTELAARDSVGVTITADRPDVSIDSPVAGDVVSDGFYVMASAENFSMSTDVGGANVTDAGHMHLYVDDAYYVFSTDGQFAVSGLASGEHTLRVELMNNDHSELSPRVFDEIVVNLE
ncbi:MAG: hypothetical protein FJ102_12455 [Deltaproteobacteria bacterium]|nr:hypothetical protein [Deltaproteobacteria bacterium]